jgi:hypothetical protein
MTCLITDKGKETDSVSKTVFISDIYQTMYNVQNNICTTFIIRFLAVQDFPILHVVQTGPRAHPTSYSMGTGGSFPAVKAAGT